MKHVTAIDNPLNGYTEGHCDSEDLGIFILSPGTIKMKNHAPEVGGRYFWLISHNVFDEDQVEFYDRDR